jgi:hypothetical protein
MGDEVMAAVGAGKRIGRPRSGAVVRHAPPKVSVVTMADVPEPPLGGNAGVADELYRQLRNLKPETAIKAEFVCKKNADYVKAKLKKLAKADKLFLSASRSVDGKTRYFWFEKL